eukprot:6274400-Prymnesium_polylepis.1
MRGLIGSRRVPSTSVEDDAETVRLLFFDRNACRAGAVGYARPLHVTADHGTGVVAARFCRTAMWSLLSKEGHRRRVTHTPDA